MASRNQEHGKICENDCTLLDDGYFHLSPNIMYSPVSIPGPGIQIEEFESQIIGGCSCINGSCITEKNCECISKYGKNYNEELKLLKAKCDGPIMECNFSCACSRRNCDNRVVQRGPLSTLEIYETSTGKGKALRSKEDIKCGTFICEYAGEVIGAEESRKRMMSQTINDMNYIFHLREHLSNGSTIHTYVDPTFIGNIGRYINHSCEPNCFIVPVRTDSPIAKLAVFSSNYISSGDEITFDYGENSNESCANNVNMKICCCGKLKCRKFLPCDLSS